MATLLYSDGFFNDSNDEEVKTTQPMPIHAPASRMPAPSSMTPDVERRREQVTLPEAPVPAAMMVQAAAHRTAPRGTTSLTDENNPLGALVLGIVFASMVWVGLAVVLFGLVYPMSFFAHAGLVALGTWIAAAGITFAFASRSQPPQVPFQKLM